jgi:hypothetical protein
MEWVIPIVVAVIGGPIVVLLQTLRKENTDQHAESRGLLEHLVIKVDKIDAKLDEHVADSHTHEQEIRRVV